MLAVQPIAEIIKELGIENCIRAWHTIFYHLMYDEMIQVNGVILFFDLTGVTMSFATTFSSKPLNTYQKDHMVKTKIEGFFSNDILYFYSFVFFVKTGFTGGKSQIN